MEVATKEVAKQGISKGYKRTQMGIIPKDWDTIQISNIGNVIRGASPRPKGDPRYYGGNVPRLMVKDVTRDGKFVTPKTDFLTEEGARRSRMCAKGTLTIVCSGTVGVPSFLAVDACIHDGFLALTGIRKDVSDDYLYHQMNRLRELFDQSATHGGVFTNLTTEILREFKLPLPPTLEEQQAIAESLSDVDGLIAELDALIEKKQQIKKGAMQQLLTGKKRLPGFGGEWEEKKLGDLLTVMHGKSQKPVASESGEYPILGTSGQIGKATSYLYDKPSVLIGRKGTIDRPQYMDKPFWTIDTLFYTHVNEDAIAKFLYYRFLLIDWTSYNEASGVPSLNSSTIENIEILFPKNIEEQQAIVGILSDMDAEIQALQSKRSKYEKIKQGMMQELLTGKTRLV